MSVQEADPDSTLNVYRRALAQRSQLFAGTDLTWVESEPQVLHFERGGRIWCMTNFGAEPVALPAGEVLLSSAPLDDGWLPTDTTVWLRVLRPAA